MAIGMSVTLRGNVPVANAYVTISEISINPISRIVRCSLDGFVDEQTRRKAEEAAAAVGDALVKLQNAQAKVAAINGTEAKSAAEAQGRNQALGLGILEGTQAQAALDAAASAAKDQILQPCWSLQGIQLGVEASGAVLAAKSLDEAKAAIYAELKKPGNPLAGGKDLL